MEFELQLVFELAFGDNQNVVLAHLNSNLGSLDFRTHYCRFLSSLFSAIVPSVVPRLLVLSFFVLVTTPSQQRFFTLACLTVWLHCCFC